MHLVQTSVSVTGDTKGVKNGKHQVEEGDKALKFLWSAENYRVFTGSHRPFPSVLNCVLSLQCLDLMMKVRLDLEGLFQP